MLARIVAIALNTYREAVRAKLLLSMLGIALATSAYSEVLGTLSLHHESRVIADVGAASTSFYAAIAAIILGATSLHREIELKTIFPILARPLRRHEYLLGKFLGTMGTLTAFVMIDVSLVLTLLAIEADVAIWKVVSTVVGMLALFGLLLWRLPRSRVYVAFPWAVALLGATVLLSSAAGSDRQLVLASAVLTLCEAAIVTAVATLFSSFSSPFLTAAFSLGVFITGRSADTLAHMPELVFGKAIHQMGAAAARVVPNLNLYVPPRALPTGDVPDISVGAFMVTAVEHAAAYTAALLVVAAVIFRRRDFQ